MQYDQGTCTDYKCPCPCLVRLDVQRRFTDDVFTFFHYKFKKVRYWCMKMCCLVMMQLNCRQVFKKSRLINILTWRSHFIHIWRTGPWCSSSSSSAHESLKSWTSAQLCCQWVYPKMATFVWWFVCLFLLSIVELPYFTLGSSGLHLKLNRKCPISTSVSV